MRALKIERGGDAVQQVTLRGDPRNPEPEHFRVVLPFGDVDIVRVNPDENSDGTGLAYWVHVRVNKPHDGGDPDRDSGELVNARADSLNIDAPASPVVSLAGPSVYHVAVRLEASR